MRLHLSSAYCLFGIVSTLIISFGNNIARAQESQGVNQNRYIWIQVPYEMTSPGMAFGGDTNCYGGSSAYAYGYGSGSAYGQSSGYTQCTQSPSIYIPSSTSNRMLSVQVDCLEKTYDAKGDSKGWLSWGQETAVYERAARACGNLELEGKWNVVKQAYEARKILEKEAIKNKTYNVELCVKWSLENRDGIAPFWILRPEMIGLRSADQVTRYLAMGSGSLYDNCKEELRLLSTGASEQRIELFWDKIKSDTIERMK